MKKLILLPFFLGFDLSITAQTSLPASWNFFSPSISNPPIGWTYAITGTLSYQATIGGGSDNVAARLDQTGEYVKVFISDKPGPLSYYLRGTGVSPSPSFSGQFDIQESADDVTYTTVRSFTTATPIPGTNPATKYTDQPLPTSRYIRFYYTSKLSGSNVLLDSVLIRTAPPSSTAGINIKIGSTTIVNNSSIAVGTTASTHFTVQNVGTGQTLTIDSIRFSGAASADYSLGTNPSTVAASSSQPLDINFAPSTNGSRLATIKIYSNDKSKSPYIINMYGIGGMYASEPTQAPASLVISNVKSHVFNVSVTAPTTKPEKYIVLRKMASSITEVPVDGVTYTKGSTIGQATVAYVGDSAIQNLQPNYIFANSPYTFAAFSYNGIPGFENYLTSSSAISTTTTLGKQPGNYYASINPNAATFLTDLRGLINPHTSIFYSNYASRIMSGYVARDTTNGYQVVNCVYTNIPYIYTGPFTWWNGSNSANLTREHSFAQSWMPSQIANSATWPTETATNTEYPEYNDMHHLFPADQANANNVRSNYPYGIVVNAVFTSPTGKGKKGTDANGNTVYEPRDEHKGDVARALMYMSICYNGIHGYNWQFPAAQNATVLMNWHQQDPPSNFEIARHEYVYSQQNNRNPFIDNPDWANRVNFTNMTYIPITVIGTTESEWRKSVFIYPNPTSGSVSVNISTPFQGNLPYEITDTRGLVIQKGELQSTYTDISLPSAQGVYFIKLQTPDGPFTTKIAKE